MRAALIRSFGEPLDVADAPDPSAGTDEVVVDLALAGVNPLDLRLRAGGAGQVPLPFVPGCDGVGQVDGERVAVYGSGIGLQRPGTYAARVAVPSQSVVPIPDALDHEQAAALGLGGVTAWGIVHASGRVTTADRVLVLGASGGVGSLVVQLVAQTGAQVWAQVGDERDAATLRDLGVNEVVVVADAVDLRQAAKALKPTVVVDALGGPFTAAAVQLVRPGGRIVVYGTSAGATSELDLGTVYRKAVTLHGHAALMMSATDASAALSTCLDLAAGGRLRALVDSVVPLAQVNDAHQRITDRQATGKILLAVGD
jgi:NADPH2:quinone reductase